MLGEVKQFCPARSFRAYSCAALLLYSFFLYHAPCVILQRLAVPRVSKYGNEFWNLKTIFFFVYDFCWGHAAALFFFFNFLGLDVLTSCLAASKADGRQFSYFAFSKLFHISEDFGVQPRALNSRMGSGNSMLLLSSIQKEKTKYQSTKFSKSMT